MCNKCVTHEKITIKTYLGHLWGLVVIMFTCRAPFQEREKKLDVNWTSGYANKCESLSHAPLSLSLSLCIIIAIPRPFLTFPFSLYHNCYPTPLSCFPFLSVIIFYMSIWLHHDINTLKNLILPNPSFPHRLFPHAPFPYSRPPHRTLFLSLSL